MHRMSLRLQLHEGALRIHMHWKGLRKGPRIYMHRRAPKLKNLLYVHLNNLPNPTINPSPFPTTTTTLLYTNSPTTQIHIRLRCIIWKGTAGRHQWETLWETKLTETINWNFAHIIFGKKTVEERNSMRVGLVRICKRLGENWKAGVGKFHLRCTIPHTF